MAGERSFLVKILGNADSAITAFKNLAREGQQSIEQVQQVGAGIGAAFDVVKKGAFIALGALTAVGGAAAGAVAAAAADEASQKSLEAQLIRSASATNAQVQATEAFIEKAMLATGIADDELRPAFGNLARATGDLDKSQRLFNLALDISASTGRDLETVTLGLGRAANGQVAGLQKLGIPLDDNIKKSKDFNAALLELEKQFGGAAATAADTFSGRVKILRTSLGEVVEEIGYQLLPVAERLVGFLQKNLIPALQGAVTGFKEEGLSGAIRYFGAAFGTITFAVLDNVEKMILGFIELEKKFVNLVKPLAVLIDIMRALGSAITGGDGIVTIEQMLEDRTASVTAKFDAWRLSIINTRAALNLSGNAISSVIDQTDKIGNKVLPKAKEATEDFNESLKKVGGAGGSAKKVKEAVKEAKDVLGEYTKAIDKVTSGQKAFNSAQKSTADAKKQLGIRDKDLATAQEEFNQAVKGYGADSAQARDAQKQLARAQRNVEEAGYRVEEAIFAVTDAEKALADARKDPESNPKMIREAEIRLAQAKLQVVDALEAEEEATNSRTASQIKLNEVVNGAIVGSAIYDALLDEVTKAKEAQEDAADSLADAIQRETDAYNDLAEAIRNAAGAAAASGQTFVGPNLPVLPSVPSVSGPPPSGQGGGGTTIVVNTGVGTNGIEAGRQIVQLLQQYTAVDAFAIDKLGFAPRR